MGYIFSEGISDGEIQTSNSPLEELTICQLMVKLPSNKFNQAKEGDS